MKISELIRIAAKNLKGRWAVLPAFGVAISVFCFCFSGAALTSVNQEKSMPYELSVSSGSTALSDNIVAEASNLPEVTAATPILVVPASIEAGEYSAELTLTGIDASYLDVSFVHGGIFPNNSVMPYIVLNEAACKQFLREENVGSDDVQIDWMNTDIYIQMGEGVRPVVSKVSGILESDDDEAQEPAAYISLTSAKQLLQQSGQAGAYTGAYIRITNIGHAVSVSKAVSGLELSVDNANEELQEGWDVQMKEMTYLIVIGVFCLLCLMVIMTAWRKISLLEQKGAYAALQWIGMKQKEIGALFIIQSVMISLIGIAAGILVSASLPSFLSPELQEASIWTLSVPFWAAFLSAVVCIIAGIVPLLNKRKSV